MGNRKLPPSLFSAKAAAKPSDLSGKNLHLRLGVGHGRDLVAFVCETRPTMPLTLASEVRLRRCPFCGQDEPVASEFKEERRCE